MKVALRSISGDERPSIEVLHNAKLSDLLMAVCDAGACPSGSCRMLFGQELLPAHANDALLSDYGIEDGANLTIIDKRIPKILTASDDNTAKIWDSATGECKQTLSGHSRLVRSAVFSVS